MGWLRRTVWACALFSASQLAGQALGAEVVLLDFQTQWCGWCRVMAPTLHELAAEGHNVRTIDGDQEPELVRKYRVEGYPTFIVLRDGHEVARVSGKTSKQELASLLAKASQSRPETADTGVARVRSQSPDMNAVRQTTPQESAARLHARTGAGPAATRSVAWEPAGNPAPHGDAVQNINDSLMAASVRLNVRDANGRSTGSGTVIDCRDGEALILTCGHMFREFEESSPISVGLFGPGASQNLPGKLVSYDLNSDVALVRVTADRPLPIARVAPAARKIQTGDPVISAGCDNGADATLRLTHIVSVNRYQHAPNLQVAFEPVQGRSGGGLFNAKGEVIGVCNAADAQDNEGLFAALAAIHAELDRANLTFVYEGNASPAAVQTPDTRLVSLSSSGAAATPAAEPIAAPVPALSLSPEEQTLLHELQSSSAAEVICLVRPLDDPAAKSRVLQVDRATPAFWRQLASGAVATSSKRLTSLDQRLLPLGTASRQLMSAPLETVRKTAMGNGQIGLVWPSRPERR